MSTNVNAQPELPVLQPHSRTCPFCSADILAEVSLCKNCGRFSRPVSLSKPKQHRRHPIDVANTAIDRWEGEHQGIATALKRVGSLHFNVPVTATRTLGVVSLVLAAAAAALWLRVGGVLVFSGLIAFLIMGAAFLLSKRVIRSSAVVEPTETTRNDTSLHIFGYDINFTLLQSVALAGMFVWAVQSEIDEAWYAAAVAVLLTPLLFRTSRQPLALAACMGGLGYLAYYWMVYTNVEARFLADYDELSLFSAIYSLKFIVFPYFLVVVLIAVVPQFQLLNVGGIGPGRFKGDVSVHLLGNDVPIAFGTSLVLISSWRALDMALVVPNWLPLALFG